MSKDPVRIALFSEVNSKFGAPALATLVAEEDVSVCAVVTSPRGAPPCSYYVGEPDPVDLTADARSYGIPVLRPDTVNDAAFVEELRRAAPDYLLIANFVQIFKAPLLGVPVVATVNFHPSPLPRYAGLAPFFWMAKHGERDGGVSAVVTDEEIDAGPVLGATPIALSGTETAHEIRERHFDESFRLLHEMLPMLVSRQLRGRPQNLARRTYFGAPAASDCTIDWAAGSQAVQRTVRAANPRPGALARTTSGEELRVLAARPCDPSAEIRADVEPGSAVRDRNGELLLAASDGWVALETDCDAAQLQLRGGLEMAAGAAR